MLESTVTSRPRYTVLLPDLKASRHLLVLEAASLDADSLTGLAERFAPVQERLHSWWVGAPVGEAALGKSWSFATLDEVLDAFACATRGYGVSDRLYVQGSEPFLWAVARAAALIGFGPGQIQLAHAGSLQRRVWCTHCHAYTEQVTTNIVPCAQCGRRLLVRDHFSRRLGAFMGVMVDAEAPGMAVKIEEVYP